MKKILLIIIALQHAWAYATPLKTDLKHENLVAYSVLTDSDTENRDKKLLELLKETDIVGFIQSKDKPELRQQQLDQLEEKLKQQAQRLQTGSYNDTYEVDVKAYDSEKQILTISQPLNNYRETVGSLQIRSRTFPQFFHVIFANGRVLNESLQLDKKAAKKFTDILKPGQTLVLQIEHRIVSLKQDKNVLTAITKVRLLNSDEEQKLIHEYAIPTAPEKIIADSWLADGITNPLVGIHAFAFYSYRLLDEFIESPMMRENCKPNGELGIHKKLDCFIPLDINESEKLHLEMNYVGAILASMKLHALTPLTENSKKDILRDIRGDLGLQKNLLMSQPEYKWTKYRVDISFYGKNLDSAVQAALLDDPSKRNFKPLLLMELHPQQMQDIYKQAGQNQ